MISPRDRKRLNKVILVFIWKGKRLGIYFSVLLSKVVSLKFPDIFSYIIESLFGFPLALLLGNEHFSNTKLEQHIAEGFLMSLLPHIRGNKLPKIVMSGFFKNTLKAWQYFWRQKEEIYCIYI